jgi:ATP-dependent RNA helicase RhlE
MGPQEHAFRSGVDVIVATPGRLLDHFKASYANLQGVEYLVLDEADRMLDMGFLPDIKRILAVLPKQRQNLLFSATFSEDIRRLAKELLRSPTLIEVARRNAPADLVTHQVYEVPATRKRALLAQLIRAREMKQVLVFVRMKRDANRLARELVRDGINATAIHSDRSQAEREQALSDFKEGRAAVLVATDIAARGLDIEQLPYVVNYELPYTPEDYVHRIGRTGRAGLPGEAISFMASDEARLLVDIEKLLKRAIPRIELPGDFERGERHARTSQHEERRPRARSHADWDDVASRAVGPRRGEREPEHRATHAKAHSHKQPAGSDFDFTKPYVPSSKTEPEHAAENTQLPFRGRPKRPTAALLGGSPDHRKSHK